MARCDYAGHEWTTRADGTGSVCNNCDAYKSELETPLTELPSDFKLEQNEAWYVYRDENDDIYGDWSDSPEAAKSNALSILNQERVSVS